MEAQRRKGSGLAGRIVRVTLVVGALTVLTAGAVAIWGASQLAVKQVGIDSNAALQLAQYEIVGRFSAIESIAGQAAQEVAEQGDTKKLDEQLGPIVSASDGMIDELIVADRSGSVITAFPTSLETAVHLSNPAFRDALLGTTGFRRIPNANGTWSLWLIRTVLTPTGRPAVLLVSADPSFLRAMLQNTAGGTSRTVTVMDGDRPLLSSPSADPPDMTRATWGDVSSGVGPVRTTSMAGRPMSGSFAVVRGIEGINWRVAVIEPDSRAVGDTLQAVTPVILVLLMCGIVGVAASLVVSRRLVRPLKALEDTAYLAANGSFVKPIPAETDDEIGQVANAFNAGALRLNALHDLSQLLASASQLDQVVDAILSAMRHIVGPGVAALYLLDDEGEWLNPARTRGTDPARVERVRADGDGWLAHAMRTNDVVVHEVDAETVRANLPGLSDDQTVALTAPLLSGHEALGVIVVLRRAMEPVTGAELEMVRTFSAQAAVAVHNSRLFEAETESLRVAEALRTVAERLVRPDGLAAALVDVEQVVADLFDARDASFALVDRPALGLSPALDRDAEHQTLELATRLFEARGHSALVVHAGEAPDVDDMLEGLRATSLLVAPIALDSDHGAVLAVWFARADVARGDLDLADAVASEVSLALDNAFLYERAVGRAANLETVFRISQAVGSSL